ncbi:MAG: hypothetical protein U0736_12330 [Gemmataceae bacterium]
MPEARLGAELTVVELAGDAATVEVPALGIDTLELTLAANPGEPARLLRKVASGGELSRTMLPLKTVLAGSDRIGTLIFDEIDANVGGRLGDVLGQKLAALGQTHQVICVTHLPQVASYARHHWTIRKIRRGSRTVTGITPLEDADRLEELASMLRGERAAKPPAARWPPCWKPAAAAGKLPPRIPSMSRFVIYLAIALALTHPAAAGDGKPAAKVYVVLWFDTEDYLLPASDDAALQVAEMLTRHGIRGTFKVVGEKARTLEARKRFDVIAALKKHEIGYHSNFHSVQPTPAMYASNLGWDEGVAEFERREGAGRLDVQRIFGVAPTCYGQPGSSWCPQSYGALKKWGMIYLDAGRHVALDGQPCHFGGVLNLYQLTHTIRADLNKPELLEKANERFAEARRALLADGGGIVSTVYHPCEWVHKQFWDGVNFSKGANPPRSAWKRPPQKSAEETKLSFRIFNDYLTFMKRFPEVQFITAGEAARLYADRARGKAFSRSDLKAIAAEVGDDVTFQRHGDVTLSASEVFDLLTRFVAGHGAGAKAAAALELADTPLGPTGAVPTLKEPVITDASQFLRTAADVADQVRKSGRVPSAVWLGSSAVPPEAYLRAVAAVAADLLTGKPMPERIEVRPARLAAAKYVSDDDPRLWGWVIFPPGFRAPHLMDVAKRQAWTLKPAVLHADSR